MEYMLLIYGDEAAAAARTAEETAQMHAEYATLTEELMRSGVLVSGSALQGTDSATAVRVRNGSTTTTDGPYAEAKEVLGGYYIVECDDLDKAIGWAAKIPGAHAGGIEVRPLMKMAVDAEPTS